MLDAVTERDEVEGNAALCRCGKGYEGHDEGHRQCWKVGAIFYTSWGYDQTNVEYYQVIRETKASVWLRAIGSEVQNGRLFPIPGAFLSKRMTDGAERSDTGEMHRKNTRWEGHPAVRMDYVRHAWPYEGGGQYETYAAGGAGH